LGERYENFLEELKPVAFDFIKHEAGDEALLPVVPTKLIGWIAVHPYAFLKACETAAEEYAERNVLLHCGLLGAELWNTGGGCTAVVWEDYPYKGVYTMVTEDCDACAPPNMRTPVIAGCYDVASGEPVWTATEKIKGGVYKDQYNVVEFADGIEDFLLTNFNHRWDRSRLLKPVTDSK
jgi:hypothetical protein